MDIQSEKLADWYLRLNGFSQGTTDSEKQLWTTFFKLWEKTVTKKAKK